VRVFAEHRRFDHYDAIYFSPHLDDAVYSCAGRIAQQRRRGLRVLVVTVFGEGEDPAFSRLAARYGDFQARRAEDRAALARLDADYVWFNHPDCLFRRPSPGDGLRAALPFLRVPESPLQRQPVAACTFRSRWASIPTTGSCATWGARCTPKGAHPSSSTKTSPMRSTRFWSPCACARWGCPPPCPGGAVRAIWTPRWCGSWRCPRGWDSRPPWLTCQRSRRSSACCADRFADESPPRPLGPQPIEDVLEDKIAAVRMYPSQTKLLLAMDERIYELLASAEGYVERSWCFPAVSAPSARLQSLRGD
jgi:hypothetical protein